MTDEGQSNLSDYCSPELLALFIQYRPIRQQPQHPSHLESQVEGTPLVISACLLTGVSKLIFTGSSGVVHRGSDIEGVDETFPKARG